MLLKIFLCFLCASVFANDRYELYERTIKSFYKKLNSDYNPQILPKTTNGIPVIVYTDIFVRKLEKVDDVNMEYSVELTFRQVWDDLRLRFSVDNQSAISFITSNDLSKFWVPDIYFVNEKKGHFHNVMTPNHYVKIFPKGTVLYSTRVSLRLSCPMNLKSFPMDRQVCFMKIRSYAYNTDYLVYLWKQGNPAQVVRGLDLPKFQFEGISTDYCSGVSTMEEISCLKVEFVFKRHFMPYFFQIYLPCCILILISWLPFWLEKEAVLVRTLINVTLLLFMLAFIQNINSSLPAVSYLKAIDVWMYGCLGFIFTSFICVVPLQFRKQPIKTCNSLDFTSDVDSIDNAEMENRKPSPVKEYHRWSRLQKLIFKDSNFVYRIMFPTAFILFAYAHYKIAKAGDEYGDYQPAVPYN